MPYSSGSFSLVSGNPVVTGTTISSSWANDTLEDIADNGLSLAVLKDGTQTITANLPMAGFKFTGLGTGSAVADSVRLSQVQNNSLNILTGVSGVTTITGNAAVTPAAYAEGQVFRWVCVGANGATPTLNVNGLGAAAIFMNGATCTTSVFRSGVAVEVIYLAGAVSTASQTGFHVIGHSGFLPTSLISAKGDLFVGRGSNEVIIVPRGTDDQVLVSTATASAGVAWKSISGILPTSSTSAAGIIEMAVQAEMEAENAGFAVTPDVMRFHPGIAKAWVVGDFTAGITVSYNVSSLTDGGTGIVTVSWGNDFSTGNYSTVAMAYADGTTPFAITRNVSGGVSSQDANFRCFETSSGPLTDATNWSIATFGDQ
jgi:hypothetical protein